MKTLKYSIQINKPRELVFNKLFEQSVYTKWAEAWGEGMAYAGEWKEGEHITFFDKVQGGTKAVVEAYKPYEHIKLKHVSMVDPQLNEVEPMDETMKKWIGSLEQYFFYEDGDDQTTLEAVAETDEAFQEMMDGAWPKALKIIKEACEND